MKKKQQQAPPDAIQGDKLEPIRFVTRELTRPDGSKLSVKVPVYPPFKLAERDRGEKKAS